MNYGIKLHMHQFLCKWVHKCDRILQWRNHYFSHKKCISGFSFLPKLVHLVDGEMFKLFYRDGCQLTHAIVEVQVV